MLLKKTVTVFRLPIRLPAQSALRVKIGLCGERKLNLLNIKMMLRRSLTSAKINERGIAGRYPGAHTLLVSGGDERFHTKAV